MHVDESNTLMKAFLTAHGRQLHPAKPDGNCLFRALSKQMAGDSSKHAELREILTSFISHKYYTRFWKRLDHWKPYTEGTHCQGCKAIGQYGSHTEIKAAASLCQRSIYVATDSLIMGKCIWTAFPPFPTAKLKLDTGKDFVSQPKPCAYSSGCHYDGILPIRSDCPRYQSTNDHSLVLISTRTHKTLYLPFIVRHFCSIYACILYVFLFCFCVCIPVRTVLCCTYNNIYVYNTTLHIYCTVHTTYIYI